MMKRILKRMNSPRKALFFIGALILICALFCVLGSAILAKIHPTKYIDSSESILEVRVPYIVNGEIDETVVEIPRGTKVQIEEAEDDQSSFRYEGTLITLDNKYLKDSLEECLSIENVYPRRLINLRDKKEGTLSEEVVKKGDKVRVIQVDPEDLDPETGEMEYIPSEEEMEVVEDGASGIIDENIYVPKFLKRSVKYPSGILCRTYISHDARCFSSLSANTVYYRIQLFLSAGRKNYSSAFLSEKLCHGLSHAITCPGNNSHLIFQHIPFHLHFFLLITYLL